MQAMNEHWEFWHVSNISRDLESSSVRVVFLPIAAAAAKSLQSCPTVCDSIDGSPSGSPSLGFSRQEHWSGLPFPSPMQESEKWKGIRSVVSDSSRLHGLQPTRLLHPWDFPGKSTGVGCHCLLQYPIFFRFPSHLGHHRKQTLFWSEMRYLLNQSLFNVFCPLE